MQELVDLERRLWLEGSEAFGQLLAADAITVMPMEDGIQDQAGTIRSIVQAPHWDTLEFGAVYTRSVAEGLRMLCYEARAWRGDEGARMLCSSLWRNDPEGWRLVSHQQTPLG